MATLMPAANIGRASGYLLRVENSAPGKNVATVFELAKAAISESSKCEIWSTEAAPNSTPTLIPSPGSS